MTTVGCNQIFKNRCILKICTFCMHAQYEIYTLGRCLANVILKVDIDTDI